MSSPARVPRRSRRAKVSKTLRYTIDASVFVNAFNPHEAGHAESLRLLATTHQHADPVIVPTLLVPEIASAVARATGDSAGALQFARATGDLPHLTLVSLTPALSRQAAELAARHGLRGADAIYLAVASRYGTTVVSRDDEQRTRGSVIALCQTPEGALEDR